VEWVSADVRTADLTELVRGADAVVHLAWLFQPSHRPRVTWEANVLGTARVLDAVVRARVHTLVCASSVGAYSPGPKDRAVDEGWPTDGWPEAAYTREKAYVERLLDITERDHPWLRMVRLRPGFVFQRAAASEQRRLFAGPLVPGRLVGPATVPVVPDLPGLRFQVVHADDVGDAIRLAVTGPARGAFNLAAEPVVDAALLADLLHARVVRLPVAAARAALATAWNLHLVPAPPQLLDAFLRLPIMDTRRAHDRLGWTPRHDARDALAALLTGLRHREGLDTPPLDPGNPLADLADLATGVGRRA
jgi:nucleoside-diphosphate-sugar epimerase